MCVHSHRHRYCISWIAIETKNVCLREEKKNREEKEMRNILAIPTAKSVDCVHNSRIDWWIKKNIFVSFPLPLVWISFVELNCITQMKWFKISPCECSAIQKYVYIKQIAFELYWTISIVLVYIDSAWDDSLREICQANANMCVCLCLKNS